MNESRTLWGRRAARALGATLVALVALGAQPAADDPLGRALAEQQERASRQPEDPMVANDLGNLLALAGRPGEAEAAYRRAIELAPKLATAHYNLGQLLIDLDRNLAARSELKRTLDLDPRHAGAYYYLGVVYARWGWQNMARRAYERAFELDPGLADPRHNPDIVGNRQALAAQLLTWSHEATNGPTRIYLQADRIAQQAQLGESSGSTAGSSGEQEEGSSTGGFARSYNAPAPEAPRAPKTLSDRSSGPSEGQVIDSSSLRRGGSVNQAQPPTTSSPRRGRAHQGTPVPTTPFTVGPESTGRIEHRLQPADASLFSVGG